MKRSQPLRRTSMRLPPRPATREAVRRAAADDDHALRVPLRVLGAPR